MKLPSLSFIALLAVPATVASPRFESNELQSRHDLLLLHDTGGVTSPVITWPWPLGRDASDSRLEIANVSFEESQVRLGKIYQHAQELGLRPFQGSLAIASDTMPFRSFGYQPREQFELSGSASWLSEWTAGRLALTFADDAGDGDDIRLDGSYFGVALGNWMLALDQVERWWGPGWDGSLILSNNARPIPAVSLTRLSPDAFQNRYLKWIGPWTFTTFMGQLDNDEGDRPGSDALLFGMRIDFSPFGWENLEIGLSRTAQWAGDGRPDGFGTFWKLMKGEDNAVPGSETSRENEPGNQLAGIDYRLRIPGYNFAHYFQIIGEDEETFLPDANMILGGIETWGELARFGVTWRAYFEWADTRAGYLRRDPLPNREFNIAYNHGIYREGYRYKGRSIGHAMDGDSVMRSIGGFLVQDNGNLWGFKLRNYAINRDGTGRHSVSLDAVEGRSVELFADLSQVPIFNLESANLRMKLGVHYIDEENIRTGAGNEDVVGYVSIGKSL